jgi:CRISPR-associated protein Cas6/Cse3/CasE subtype I-E
MYFSQITLENEIKLNPYKIHQKMYKFFDKKEGRDFIYRVIGDKILVYCQQKPKSYSNVEVKTKEYTCNFVIGQELKFSVDVCPVVKVKNSRNKSKKCDPFLYERQKSKDADMKEALSNWFKKRIETLGFSISDFVIIVRDEDSFLKNGENHRYVHYEIQGVLKVEDVEKFNKAIELGIGDKRGFGCGMLLLSN